MAKKQREYQQSLEKSKALQTEQQHRLEMVKCNNITLVFSLPNLKRGNLPSISQTVIKDRFTNCHQFHSLTCIFRTTLIMIGRLLICFSDGKPCPLQLQQSLDEAQSRLLEMEQELKLFHLQKNEAQNAAALLQNSLDQLSQVQIHHNCSAYLVYVLCDYSFCLCYKILLELQQKQDEVRHMEELLQTFKEQAEQSASKVCATMIVVRQT